MKGNNELKINFEYCLQLLLKFQRTFTVSLWFLKLEKSERHVTGLVVVWYTLIAGYHVSTVYALRLVGSERVEIGDSTNPPSVEHKPLNHISLQFVTYIYIMHCHFINKPLLFLKEWIYNTHTHLTCLT